MLPYEQSLARTRRSLLFDNLDMKLLHRRLTTAGLNTLEGMREEAFKYAQQIDQTEHWHLLWKHSLPSVAMYNQFVQRSMAKDVLDRAPEVEGALRSAFEVYCKQYFGKDVHGNVNIIQGTVPPFSEFYHCFLTRLCAEAAVVRLQVFDSHDLLQKAVKNAIVDALRDTSVDRVHILETMTEEEYKERRRRARRSRSRSTRRREDKETSGRRQEGEDGTSSRRQESSKRREESSGRREESSRREEGEDGSRREEGEDGSRRKEGEESSRRGKEDWRQKQQEQIASSRGAFVLNGIHAPTKSAHGLEWQKNLDATYRTAHVGALGPDDSASSLHSVGVRFQAESGVAPPSAAAPAPALPTSGASNIRRIDMSMLPKTVESGDGKGVSGERGGESAAAAEYVGYVETPASSSRT